MSALNELLERLRRLRPPPGGPATVVAVPSAGDDVAREVAFLFEELDAVEARAGAIGESVRIEAGAVEGDARSQRAQILADAQRRAERVFAEVLDTRRTEAEREAQLILMEGRRSAAAVRARGREATPSLVEEVVRRIVGEPC